MTAKFVFLETLKSRNRLLIYDCPPSVPSTYIVSLLRFRPQAVFASKRALDTMASCTTRPDLSFVKSIAGGSQIIPKKTRLAANTLCGGREVFRSAYGCTEAGCMTRQSPGHSSYESTGQGFPAEGAEGKIIDDAGKKLSDGNTGTLYFRTTCMMKGYWRNPVTTAETIDPDGWYNTGDIGYIDPKSKEWHITGRIKEIIKVHGKSVSPHAIEECLLTIPGVAIAVVVAVRRDDGEELPVAFIVRDHGKGMSLGEREVKEHMKREMNADHQVTGGVVFLIREDVPYGGNGKIMRMELKEKAYALWEMGTLNGCSSGTEVK